MNVIKQMLDLVDARYRVHYFTPAGAAEVLNLATYPWYTTIYADMTSYTGTIKLPPVAEFDGITYDIFVKTGSNVLTITDHDGDSDGWNDLTIEDAHDHVRVTSSRVHWAVETNVEAD